LERGNNKLKAKICRDCADKCAFSAEDEILLNEYSKFITRRNQICITENMSANLKKNRNYCLSTRGK